MKVKRLTPLLSTCRGVEYERVLSASLFNITYTHFVFTDWCIVKTLQPESSPTVSVFLSSALPSPRPYPRGYSASHVPPIWYMD